MGHPAVAGAAVIVVADEKWTERPLAVVTFRRGATATPDELREFIATKVARWWLPERIEIIEAIPKTAVGKFNKRALRAVQRARARPDPSRGRHMTQPSGPTPHLYRGWVAWADTDAGGRIHFTAAFRWAEAAEHDLLRSLGHRFRGGFPRVDVRATYRAALRFDDEFGLALGVGKVGTTSVRCTWQIRLHGLLAIEGRHSAVYVGDGEQPEPLPTELRGQLTAKLTSPGQ